MRRYIFTFMMMLLTFLAEGQTHNYWTRSFNEESSLLSGAVVGGGSGPSAIYYNPASISEVQASKFSLNASLFSFAFINVRNALGDGIDLEDINAKVEPRFISYMLKPKRHKRLSFEIAFLNNENEEAEVSAAVDESIDILTSIPGNERYFAFYKYKSHFRDDWIGIGMSRQLGKKIILGLSMFASIKTLYYSNTLDIDAYPLNDSVYVSGGNNSFYAAISEDNDYLKFNDYRLLWKAGLLCKWEYLSLGLSITTPSVGVYSDGKRVERKQLQANITNPETGEPIPDYLIADYQEKGNVDVSFKTPFSVSAGLTYHFRDNKRILYLSMEYFSGIDPYRMVEADESDLLTQENDKGLFTDWLTYVSGARPVFNAAAGYSWTLSEKVKLKAGFRTDFNYQKNLDYGDLSEYSKLNKLNLDHYYITCGFLWKLMGQDIVTGLQYCVGRAGDQTQLANLSDPVEYDFTEKKALQGTRTNDMVSLYNSFIIYLGLSLNFGGNKNP